MPIPNATATKPTARITTSPPSRQKNPPATARCAGIRARKPGRVEETAPARDPLRPLQAQLRDPPAGRSARTSNLRRDGVGGVDDRRSLLRALIASVLIGLLGGGACVLFYACTQICDQTRLGQPALLYLLPATGLLIVFLYDGLLGDKDLSTGALFRLVQENKPVSPWIAPLIFLSTCLAYLTGGSVGRAGSALQIGGGIGAWTGSRLDGRREDTQPDSREDTRPDGDPAYARRNRLLITCGMSAGFTAILNTPLAGAVFGIEVLVLSRQSWGQLLPALISSYLTWGIAAGFEALTSGGAMAGFDLSYTDFSVPAELFSTLSPVDYGKLALLTLLSTLAARLYCYSRRSVAWSMQRFIKNPYLRVLTGAFLVILITRAIGTMDCNGVGFSYVAGALAGSCAPLSFLWKLLLTIVTLGCGIRGGEIAPNIFIGATFGCALAPLFGLDPCIGAAACLVCVLSSATNCTIAIFIYGCEAICFSPAAALVFLIASVIAHIFSGEMGIYREQPTDRIIWKVL